MSETPETYAVWPEVAKIDVKHVPRVLRDHAEKMERERNEAREVAERLRPPTALAVGCADWFCAD